MSAHACSWEPWRQPVTGRDVERCLHGRARRASSPGRRVPDERAHFRKWKRYPTPIPWSKFAEWSRRMPG